MDLTHYFRILWAYRWVVILTTEITLVVLAVQMYFTPETYTSKAVLRVLPYGSNLIDFQQLQYFDRLTSTYVNVAQSDSVQQELIYEIGVSEEELDYSLQVIGGTELLEITATNQDPVVAQQIANTLARLLLDPHRLSLDGGGGPNIESVGAELAQVEGDITALQNEYKRLIAQIPQDTQAIASVERDIATKEKVYDILLESYTTAQITKSVREGAVSLVESAEVPLEAEGPFSILTLVLGGVVGLGGGIFISFLLESLSPGIHSDSQIEGLVGVPLIGKISHISRKDARALLQNGPAVESFRFLATRMTATLWANGETASKAVLVTSAQPQDGKSTVTANLAYALAHQGVKVVVIDADLRRPKQYTYFDLPNEIGLADYVLGKKNPYLVKRPRAGVQVITAGSGMKPPLPAEWAVAVGLLIDALKRNFDLILIDSPALLAVADAMELAPAADAVLLVARREATKQNAFMDAYTQLSHLEMGRVDVVLTNHNRGGASGWNRYYTKEKAPKPQRTTGSVTAPFPAPLTTAQDTRN